MLGTHALDMRHTQSLKTYIRYTSVIIGGPGIDHQFVCMH